METIHLGLSNGPIQKGLLEMFGVEEVHLGYKKKNLLWQLLWSHSRKVTG